MKKILIINRLGIGDVVLTTPLAQAIKEHIAAKIGFVVAPKAVDIISNHPYIDDVFAYRQPSKKAMLEQIRAQKYDEALIVDERLSSTLLAYRAGCRLLNKGFEISIGKRRLFSGKQYAEKAALHYTSYIKYVDQNADIRDIAPTVGRIDEQSRNKVEGWLREHNFLTEKFVLVVPRGLTDNKNWLPEYFAEVNNYFNERQITPVYLGSKNDIDYIENIPGTKINVAGLFTLREVAFLAQQAALCISLCTGTMHIVATANTPIIALYGPTSPARWAPRHALVLRSDLPCVPCEKLYCANSVYKQCMREITPQKVIDIIASKAWLKQADYE